jgi:hypothetical protein
MKSKHQISFDDYGNHDFAVCKKIEHIYLYIQNVINILMKHV